MTFLKASGCLVVFAFVLFFDFHAVPAFAATCGDGAIESPETCDDSDADSGDGCSDACAVESGWTCMGEPSVCTEDPWGCGDGVIESPETCDDCDADSGDGCSSACAVESGWACVGEPSECAEVAPVAEGDVESTVHKVIVASAPFVCLAAFFAACWGWPLKRRK